MAAATFSQTFFAPGGGVAASCKAYTYVRGTTTPLAAYTDVGLTTPATNPVIGSGVGVLLFYLDGDEDYSLTIKTSDDATTLMQVDYVANGGFFSIISYTIENVQFAEFPFTGDGTETEFTLPDVLAPSVHSLWVTIDGIYQPVGTYSIVRDATDTHVTLVSAPANGAEISIRLMALQGQAGDSAYQIAVNNGFVGTEPEWLETLIGTSSRDEQVFSGDGSDLTFVFTGMVIIDKLNITIFVDGIIQRESDYSLSNNGTDTTITFGTAPPLGTNNIVMRGAVLTGGGGGTGDVVGPASVTDGRFALFDTTSGKLIKQHTGAPGALAVKNTVATADIDNDAVTFDKLLNATAAGFIGATGSGNFSERTPAQVTAALDAVVGDSGAGGTKGLVPAPAAGDAAASKFLKADGTWAVPSGGGGGSGDVVGPASSTTNHVVGFADTTGKLIKALTAAQIRGAAALDSIDSPEFAGINVGHASDTTITRVSAGVIAVEGVTIPTASSTTTFTNKTLTSPVINTPTGIVKGDVGLGNVDNTSNATERAASATLTNKTLTTPTINGAALSGTLSGAPTLSGLITFSAGADMTPAATPSTTAVGYLGAPQRSISAADTFVMSDAGKHLYHPAADTSARVWTIPANASVAYPIGTVIGIVNENAAGVITLAITSDTLRWGSSTGSRTLAANATATLLKVTSTVWRLTGDGIT